MPSGSVSRPGGIRSDLVALRKPEAGSCRDLSASCLFFVALRSNSLAALIAFICFGVSKLANHLDDPGTKDRGCCPLACLYIRRSARLLLAENRSHSPTLRREIEH